ncbi:MAG: LssY C-terminal domain-containing protein [Thermodesulfobacteriota bacterium]
MKTKSKLILFILLAITIFGCSKKYCSVGEAGTPGCPSYNPVKHPESSPPVQLRSQTQSKDGLEVSTAVLTDRESTEIFGLDLAEEDIQPIWINIKNNTNEYQYIIKVYTDPHYFTPNEVAKMNHVTFAIDVNEAIDSYVNNKSISRQIPPKSEVSGFYYSTWDPGYKYLNIALYSENDIENFLFLHDIPGLKLDYQRVDFENLYKNNELTEIKTCEELVEVVKSIPCCTQKKDGTGENDPLNFVVIGEPDEIFGAFLRQGWDVTETINIGSGWRAFKAFFSNERWRTSPMSSLYFYNRSQDIGLQKARSTIHERNHLRLWVTPYSYQGKNVWIGAISRDLGSYFTWKTQWKTAHAIDPDIDEARNYLMQDMIYSQSLKQVGLIEETLASATRDEPHINFMEQPWWTDGRRAILIFDNDITSINDLEDFDCE